jgi:hypothetical protein
MSKGVHSAVVKPPAGELLPRGSIPGCCTICGKKNLLAVPPVQHPACVVQSNQGVVDCGPAQATVAIPGVLQGLGVFSTGKQSFLLI